MKLTSSYLKQIIKEEIREFTTNENCGPIIGDEPEEPTGAVDLPDDPNEAFGVGYNAALEEILATVQGLLPNKGPGGEGDGEAVGDIESDEEMME